MPGIPPETPGRQGMLARILSAAVLIPITLAFVFFADRPLFVFIVGILGTVCIYEYLELAEKMGMRSPAWMAYSGFWILFLALQAPGSAFLYPGAVLVLLFMACFVVSMGRTAPVRDRVNGFLSGTAGILYISLCLYPAAPLRFEVVGEDGRSWVTILLITLWVGDTAALFIGRRFGRTRFSPVISPRKTNEGAAAGLLGGIAAAVACRSAFFPDLSLGHVVVGSLLIGVSGQLGDLAESLLKRAAGVKDSSGLIPGHGGLLDRMDSLLFALPVLYLYLMVAY